MKGQLEMYSDGVRLTKATRTRWSDHKICAMERIVDQYRLYCLHLQHVVTCVKIKRQSFTTRKVQQASRCKNSL